ncbi:MAG: D-glycero-beta-D-manno-heptose-7-phosphate kinase [Proteobacteria bacterium]|nr:D-glycero-beta-D-manno-heptose-7-phosphate kinase [Pseudomonadota bacterium]MBU1686758.1 D-glycero-beta-D-manno-heptose-7-phosphate kinase [Pseudomonadota bacterium]
MPKFKQTKILVIGDIIVDHFIWGTVTRISPEAPVPVVNVTRESLLLGGGANVLNNIYSLGGQASLCGIVGQDIMGEHLRSLIEGLGSSTQGVIQAPDRPTTKKTRIIAQHQQVVRFDREKTDAIPKETLASLLRYLEENIETFQAVIISDYDKGLVSQTLMTRLMELLAQRPSMPVIVDPKPKQIDRFRGTTILTPNHHEAALMAGMAIVDEESLMEAARRIQEDLKCKALLITRGESGMTLFSQNQPPFSIPTVAREVFDVTGAGDTVVATLALGVAAGLTFKEAATLANYAAGIVVGKLGTATATPEEILGAMR